MPYNHQRQFTLKKLKVCFIFFALFVYDSCIFVAVEETTGGNSWSWMSIRKFFGHPDSSHQSSALQNKPRKVLTFF